MIVEDIERERERIECKCIAITEKIYTQYLQGHLRSPSSELPMVSDNPYDKTIRDIEQLNHQK